MKKFKQLLYLHRYFFIFLGFILLYETIVAGRCSPWSVGSTAYSMYALDYSFGFTDKLLPGALYGLFFKDLSQKYVDLFSVIGLLLFFAALALLLEKIYLSATQKDRPLFLLLFCFFLTGPATFSVFVVELGLIEVFWAYLAVIFFIVIRHRRLVLLSVLLCVIALLVNDNAVIAVVPMFCISLLYQLSFEEDKAGKKFCLAAFIICVCVSLLFFLYLAGFGSKTLAYDYPEFVSVLEEKGADSQYAGYFFYGMEHYFDRKLLSNLEGYSFYSQYATAFNESAGIERLFNFLTLSFKGIGIVRSGEKVVLHLLELFMLLPVLGIQTAYFFSRLFDRTENKLRRFVFFCMPALFVLDILSGFLVSLDHGKWIAYAFIQLFAMFLFVLSKEEERVVAFIRKVLLHVPPAVVAIYFLIYAFTFFPFY